MDFIYLRLDHGLQLVLEITIQLLEDGIGESHNPFCYILMGRLIKELVSLRQLLHHIHTNITKAGVLWMLVLVNDNLVYMLTWTGCP